MARSLRVHKDYTKKVKSAVKLNGFARQTDLAEELNLSRATVSNFLNGRPVDYLNFIEICRKLGLDWQAIAQFEEDVEEQDNEEKQEQPVSDFYIERVPYEAQCYQEILKPGALIRIKAPEQMGKTTLLAKVLARARNQGYQALTISFELADSTVFTNLRQFSQWFCASVGQSLGLPNQLAEYWDDIFGCNSNTTDYFQTYLLAKLDNPLILALDNVDLVFEHSAIADDFCRLLRGWYDIARRGDRNSATWKKLRLVVVHSTEVYSSLDINHSPLSGIGLVVELSELTPKQVQDLAQRHGLHWSVTQVEKLMAMIGGHPYLVQLALDSMKHQNITLEQLLLSSPTEAGIYSDHLRRHLKTLQQYPDLASAFCAIVTADSAVKIASEQAFKLNSMGLVHLQGNEVTPRCDLYRQYFRDRLKT
jgi:transcriptional regulator with XRE-family HTH domain